MCVNKRERRNSGASKKRILNDCVQPKQWPVHKRGEEERGRITAKGMFTRWFGLAGINKKEVEVKETLRFSLH